MTRFVAQGGDSEYAGVGGHRKCAHTPHQDATGAVPAPGNAACALVLECTTGILCREAPCVCTHAPGNHATSTRRTYPLCIVTFTTASGFMKTLGFVMTMCKDTLFKMTSTFGALASQSQVQRCITSFGACAGVAQSRDQLLSKCKDENHVVMLTPPRKQQHGASARSVRMVLVASSGLCASFFVAMLVTWGVLTHGGGSIAADCASGPPLLLWGVGMSAGLCKFHVCIVSVCEFPAAVLCACSLDALTYCKNVQKLS